MKEDEKREFYKGLRERIKHSTSPLLSLGVGSHLAPGEVPGARPPAEALELRLELVHLRERGRVVLRSSEERPPHKE